MDTDALDVWRHCFQQWPAELERRGVLVASFGEQIVFDGFAASDRMLLLERRTPDTVGGRMVLIPYGNIQAVKIVDVVKIKAFHSLGFTAPPPRK